MGNPRKEGSRGHRRTKLWHRVRAEGRPCWICQAFGKPGEIDYSLPARHPLSFEMDDLQPVSKGGDPCAYANMDAAHRCCNIWRGNKSVAEVMRLAREYREGKAGAKAPCAAGLPQPCDW